ncbi:MAG: DUF433 domain-containing protein [Armatimonadota bacterium]
MNKQQCWIVSNPKVLGGKPVIRGTRISVAFIIQCLASGMTVDDILKGHPHLTREAVLAAIDYAAQVMENERVLPTNNP